MTGISQFLLPNLYIYIVVGQHIIDVGYEIDVGYKDIMK